MKIGKRKAWIEKQPEEIRLYVLKLLGDPAVTYPEASCRIQAKFGLKVPASTLAYSRSLTVGQDEEDLQAAKQEAAAFTEFMRQNPDVPEERLRKVWFYRRLASKEFRDSAIEPGKLVFLAQRERELELRERQIAAVERQNELKGRQVEMQVEKMRRDLEEATHEATSKIGKGEAVTVDDINRIRERTFGLPPLAAGPPA
ncbi:MAG TPA: hypothetical protein VMX97_03330 [Hyphomicrobiaceae bacterium]|nr:hypothetical protein [Hyphomicrobiaceae bacterium]